MYKYFYFICFFLCTINAGYGQQSDSMPAIPAMRQLHHEYIIRSWEAIRTNTAKLVPVSDDEQRKVDRILFELRSFIERSELIDNNGKYTWLRGVNDILTGYINNSTVNRPAPTSIVKLLETYQTAMQKQLKGESIAPLMQFLDLESAGLFAENIGLLKNIGIVEVKDSIVVKQCVRNPDRILPILVKSPGTASAESLIIQAAFRNPEELYSYAAAPNSLGKKIQSVNHPFVKIVAQLAGIHLGVVSVYRTLELFFALGLISQVFQADGLVGYLPASFGHHHFIVCQKCQKAVEFSGSEDMRELVQRVQTETRYQVSDHLLQFYGLCPECQALLEAGGNS